MRRFALIRGACFLKPWRNRAQSVSDGQIESYVVNRRHTNYELLATGNWRLNTSHKPQATSDQRPATRSAGTIAQKYLIMQNKPNFPRFCAKNTGLEEKQTQFKPNSNPIKANSNPILSQMRRKQTQSNPISNHLHRKQTQSNPILNQSRAAVPQF